MIEEIYKILESSGWTRKIVEGAWAGYHTKTIQSSGGTMIINGRRMEGPSEVTRIEVEYKGDGWIENADGSGHQETTQWDIRVTRGDLSKETTIIVYSPEQFMEMMNELGL